MFGERRASTAPAVLFAAISLAVGACTSVVEGLPVGGSGGLAAVDTARLDVGDYPTTPRPELGRAGTSEAGALIEAQRMGNYVIGPWEIDPALKSKYGLSALVLADVDALIVLGSAELAAAAGRHSFVNGFLSARQAQGRLTLMNTVLRFADPPSAVAAAADMGKAATRPGTSGQLRPVVIPGERDALATSFTFVDDHTNRRWSAVRSFIAHGPYVLTQLAESVDGPDPAASLIASTISRQRLVIDQFQATAPARFADVNVDPTGQLARTLPMPPQQATVVQNARYGKRGALHFQDDPLRTSALFDQTVMDLATMGKTTVYRTIDAEAATRIVDEFAAEVEATGGESVDGVKSIPASRCLQLIAGFYCVAPADRYAIEAQSRQPGDARQQVAAQYALLVAK